ncbi:hypothetical protein CRG98_037695 [Punica granatum]|uniref:Retrotransposon gag domain-containing protein n=1 Tax=Punica granatum TaxID=22663 RepID=A0A2I0ID76_PUNGR|nr:hypothetical protein CRG98_037695 [Punica granatum]
MSPRRAVNQCRAAEEDELDRRIEQIMHTRLGVALECRLDVMVDNLAERMGALMEARQEVDPRRDQVPNPTADLDDGEYDSFSNDDETESVGGNRRRAMVEEVLEFKGVPDDKRVQLVATRLRGRATTWWQQVKLTRSRMGKPKITSWEKINKNKRAAFLPYNFQRIMYQRLRNLRQGGRSVDDYTNEFYQLVARNKLEETEDQLVASYIGGLRVQLQDTVNLFDHVSVSSAHQRALIVERQHKKGERRAMFIEEDSSDDVVFIEGGGGEPNLDEEEEIVIGDGVPNLVVRRSCMTSRAADEDWLRNNIFQSTCTIEKNVCRFMIDSGSCENIVSAEAV